MVRRFPDGFVFGCATSAYQVEGGITNDWALWEQAGRLKDPGARCAAACDHWNRFEEDFALLSALGVGAYRLSVEWARVEPEPGRFDDDALQRYVRMLDALRARGVEPIVTLLHFTHPTWFHEACPWHDPSGEAARRFERFVRRTARAFGPRVRRYTALNEPGPWLAGAYLGGVIPPGVKSLGALTRAFTGLVRAHAAAYRALKEELGAGVEVGLAHNVLRFAPARDGHPLERAAARWVARHYNHAFPSALTTGRVELGTVPGLRVREAVPEAKGTLDFLGVNYYSRVFLRFAPRLAGAPVAPFYEGRSAHGLTDLGWEIHPEGLTASLLEMRRYGVPLWVTENGLDDRDDTRRSAFLHDHLGAVLDAIEQGADVRGYLHWSLLDNFEWLEGFEPRFGLYQVDYATQARRATRAAEVYRRIIAARALDDRRPEATVRPSRGPTPVF